MQHVFLDFEMNPIPYVNREAREVVRNEIIQIGAVKLDEAYNQIDKYSAFVRPVLNTVTAKITALTGITNADVAGAPEFADALRLFADWIGTEPTRIYSWSDTDKYQLWDECILKDVALPRQFNRWMDFQRVYTRLVGLSARSPLSLKNALGTVETDFSGAQHSAADDAENSAALLRLVHDKEAFARQTQIIRSVMKPDTAKGATLGSLFGDKLSKFQFADE